jgi:hypothetical protein
MKYQPQVHGHRHVQVNAEHQRLTNTLMKTMKLANPAETLK